MVAIMFVACFGVSIDEPLESREKKPAITFVVKRSAEGISRINRYLEYTPCSGLRDIRGAIVSDEDIANLLKADKEMAKTDKQMDIRIDISAPKETTISHLDELMNRFSTNNNSLIPIRVIFWIPPPTKKKQ